MCIHNICLQVAEVCSVMQNIAATVDILTKQLSVMDTKLDAITDKTTVMSKVLLLKHYIILIASHIAHYEND
jgi:hypothetical protein